MKSIQSQLVIGLSVAMIAISLAGGGTIAFWLRREMVREFDRSLAVRGRAMQSLIAQKPDGQLDIDINLKFLSEFEGQSATEYFSFDDAQGNRVAESSSIGIAPAAAEFGHAWDTLLPNHAPARAMRLQFVPGLEPEEEKQTGQRVILKPITLTVTVARDRHVLDMLLWRITLTVSLATFTFSVLAVVVALVIVRRGLAGLRGLGAQVSAIDVLNAQRRLPVTALPGELKPIAERLNELLGRVEIAIRRERQFSAAVSHELRTPVAELRAATDIALRDPANAALAQRATAEANDIAIQMQTMIATLLSIARGTQTTESATLTPILLCDAIDQAVSRHTKALAARKISVKLDLPFWRAMANHVLLDAVLDNLIVNAASYATLGTALRITASEVPDRIVVAFENEHEGLDAKDIEHLFDPFWRKDESRGSGQHIGLGLSLVKVYANSMRATLKAELGANNRFRISLGFEWAAEPQLIKTDQPQVVTVGNRS